MMKLQTRLRIAVRANCPQRITPRVVRIALIGDPIARAHMNLELLADALVKGTPEERTWVADRLREIANGVRAEDAFGLTPDRNLPRDPDRTTIMALDYLVRTNLTPRQRKVAAKVAVDWRENSVDTVKQIYRRMRPAAEQILQRFAESETQRPDYVASVSTFLLMEAIAAARHEILHGTPAPVYKRPEDVIQTEIDLYHLLRFYSDIRVTSAKK